MALGSLAVAGAALFYSYRLHTSLSPASSPSQPAMGDAATSDNVAAPDKVATPDNGATPHTGGSNERPVANRPSDTTSASLSGQSDRARNRNRIDWDDPLDDGPRSDTPTNTTPTDDGEADVDSMLAEQSWSADVPSPEESDPLEDPLDTPIEQPAGKAPRLAEVRTTFRPNGQRDSVTTTIANAGDGDAQISELIFRPLDVVELPLEASRPEWGQTDDEHLVVTFNESENRTSTQGKHGDYGHELLSPFNLAAGRSVDINLAIKNANHTGYGLRGQLILRLSNGDDFDVEEVTLAFVNESR